MRIKLVSVFILVCFLFVGCGKDSTVSTDNVGVTAEATEEQVKDIVPPEIATNTDAIYSNIGEKINYDDYFIVSDDMDDSSSIKIEYDDSKIDFNAPGKYSLKVSASDSSNNSSALDFPVYVYKEYTPKELSDILDKLIDEEYYDYTFGDYDEDLIKKGYPYFVSGDLAFLTDEPSGSDHIYGWIDYLVNNVTTHVFIESNRNDKSDTKRAWRKKFVVWFSELTSYADLLEVDKIIIVSKSGKMELNTKDNLYCNKNEH